MAEEIGLGSNNNPLGKAIQDLEVAEARLTHVRAEEAVAERDVEHAIEEIKEAEPQRNDRDEAKWKAEQQKQRKEQAIANTTGLRVLTAIGAAVPVRLLKRDLLFVIEQLMVTMDESRIEMLARQHGIRQKRDDGGIKKTLAAFVRRADEGTLSRLLVEASILLAASRGNPSSILKEAATAYKVDTDAIATKVKQEFAAKEKAKKTPQPTAKVAKKAA